MKQLELSLKTISAQETYPVRHPILREGRPLSECEFEGDEDPTTIHLGLYSKEKLIGVATFLKKSNPCFSEKVQYQLRGMAILQRFQNKGLGKIILDEAERLLTNKCHRIWFNARKIAVNFYEKNGYKKTGEPFEIANVGVHYVMTKKII
ncbi:GNAT family N-acetyltransferase [Hanstruepera ponticola]|uniref:GNAT family N-acetyltransferase n=1 Tax=Hanstruepera ponticola TaxID=2042995 RepID=UPI0017822937|nr:GNAT family N-acetyltransferase [Hanstruepera ponticola]